jgi:hypothetical protein
MLSHKLALETDFLFIWRVEEIHMGHDFSALLSVICSHMYVVSVY